MYKLSELESWKTARELRQMVSTLVKHFPKDAFDEINDHILLCLKILNGYIAYLKKSKQGSKNEN